MFFSLKMITYHCAVSLTRLGHGRVFISSKEKTNLMIIIIVIIIIIITLKGTIRDFYNLPTVLQTVSNTYAQVARVQSCANHVQVQCNTSSAYHMQPAVCHLVCRDSSAIRFDRVEIALILPLFC